MTNYDLDYRMREFTESLNKLSEEVAGLKSGLGINELWDGSDLCRNWKVSPRTVASWRADGIIDYVQVGSKIWYPKDLRDNFIKSNIVQNLI